MILGSDLLTYSVHVEFGGISVLPSLAFSVAQFAVVLFASDNGCETGLLNASCHSKAKQKKLKAPGWSSAIVVASSFVDAAAVFSLACQIRVAGFGQS